MGAKEEKKNGAWSMEEESMNSKPRRAELGLEGRTGHKRQAARHHDRPIAQLTQQATLTTRPTGRESRVRYRQLTRAQHHDLVYPLPFKLRSRAA